MAQRSTAVNMLTSALWSAMRHMCICDFQAAPCLLVPSLTARAACCFTSTGKHAKLTSNYISRPDGCRTGMFLRHLETPDTLFAAPSAIPPSKQPTHLLRAPHRCHPLPCRPPQAPGSCASCGPQSLLSPCPVPCAAQGGCQCCPAPAPVATQKHGAQVQQCSDC